MESKSFSITGTPFAEQDYRFFCKRVELRFRIRLSDYKPEQMMRRVAAIARQNNCPSFIAYVGLLERDRTALEAFLDLMTINVTEFFRNGNVFEEFSEKILPLLNNARPGETFSAWSAGCSNGAEAYSLAMILQAKFGDKPYRIKGTDIDLSIIAKAGSPAFTSAELAGVTLDRRAKFFSSPDDQTFMPKLILRKNIHFTRHDLLSDAFPNQEYDLILCRNVVIYFNDDAKERIYEGFFRALKPGGILFVGGTERIATAAKIGYETLRPFFYQKPALVDLRRAA